jgi:nucleoside-diphosphate-sugar epimerase
MQNILIIGGTGTISLPTTLKLSENPQNRVTVINRGSKNDQLPSNITVVKDDILTRLLILLFLIQSLPKKIVNFLKSTPINLSILAQLLLSIIRIIVL